MPRSKTNPFLRPSRKASDRGTWERDQDYAATLRETGDHKQAVRSYCAGNQWATENAKAVGNWPKDDK